MDLKARIQELKDPDPKRREAAIRALAKSGDERVIKALGWAYKNDPDPRLRELALKAAKHIRQQQESGSAASPPPPPPPPKAEPSAYQPDISFLFDDDDEAEAAAPASGAAYGGGFASDERDPRPDFASWQAAATDSGTAQTQAQVSERDKRTARSMVDRAMEVKLRGDMDKAIELITQAFTLDPSLTQDMMAIGLAASIFDTTETQAAEMLTNPAIRQQLQGRARGRSKKAVAATEDDLYGAIFWLMLYFIMNFAVFVGLWYFIGEIIDEMLAQDSQITVDQREALEDFRNVAATFAILGGVALGFFSTFLQMLWAYLIHFVATSILLAKGSYVRLLRNLTAYTIIFTLIGYGINIAPYLYPGFSLLLCIFFPVLLIGSIYYFIKIITDEYDMQFMSGCLTVIISVIIYMIGYFGLLFGLALLTSGL